MADDDTKVTELPIDTDEVVAKVSDEVKEKITAELTDKVSADVAEKVTSSVVESITEKLGGKKHDKWIPKDYEEIKNTTKQETLAEVDARLTAREEEQRKKDEEKAQEATKRQEQWEKSWTNQIDTLTKEGHIPAPSDEILKKLEKKEALSKEELDDDGIKMRRELYRLADEHKEYDLEKVYYKFVLPNKDKISSGAYAPVTGSSKTVSTDNKSDYSYEEIHNARDFSSLAK